MKKSVQIIKQRGNIIQSRTAGQISKDIVKVLSDIFSTDDVMRICDALGSVLIPNPDLTDEEWIKQMIEED